MIKASELRIGNLLHAVTALGCPIAFCKVLTITQNYTEVEYQLLSYGAASNNPGIAPLIYMDAEPIRLTPEILEKCGFERDDEEDCNGYLAYRPRTAHYAMGLFINDKRHVCAHYLGRAISTNHPQFLHQLQNLYFALTGEELDVKL